MKKWDVTEYDAERRIKTWLAGWVDRDGGRKQRAEKKKGTTGAIMLIFKRS